MDVEGFSPHIFWSYNRSADIKSEIVIKQVISYGEVKDMNLIKRNINKLFPNHRVIRQDHNLQIDVLVNEVKVTFFSTGAVAIPFSVREHSFAEEKLNIARAKAIAALKFSAIAQRNTIRDYYDLYCMSHDHFPLLELIQIKEKL